MGLNFDIAIEHNFSLSRVFYVLHVDYSILLEKRSILSPLLQYVNFHVFNETKLCLK